MNYPIEADGSIPAFTSREEAAEWFDTHDLTQAFQEGRPVQIRQIRRTYSQSMQVRLDAELDRDLQRFADAQGVKKSTLARVWLEQRVRQEREQHAS